MYWYFLYQFLFLLNTFTHYLWLTTADSSGTSHVLAYALWELKVMLFGEHQNPPHESYFLF